MSKVKTIRTKTKSEAKPKIEERGGPASKKALSRGGEKL